MNIIQDISTKIGITETILERVFLNIVGYLVIWVVYEAIVLVAHRLIKKVRSYYKFKKATAYSFVLIGVLMTFIIWIEELQKTPTFFGLISAGIAIALKDLIVNITAWFFIMWRKPFEAGDRIEVGNVIGDVIDQRLFQYTLLEVGNWVNADQSTGRIVHVPNSSVFNLNLANYSKGFKYIWDEIEVIVTFESDWKKSKEILFEIVERQSEFLSRRAEKRVREAAKKFMIFYNNLTPTVYTDVVGIGVRLTARYLCEPRKRRPSKETIWEEILDAFSKHDNIDFAYQTQRIYYNHVEGKEGTKLGKDNLNKDFQAQDYLGKDFQG